MSSSPGRVGARDQGPRSRRLSIPGSEPEEEGRRACGLNYSAASWHLSPQLGVCRLPRQPPTSSRPRSPGRPPWRAEPSAASSPRLDLLPPCRQAPGRWGALLCPGSAPNARLARRGLAGWGVQRVRQRRLSNMRPGLCPLTAQPPPLGGCPGPRVGFEARRSWAQTQVGQLVR